MTEGWKSVLKLDNNWLKLLVIVGTFIAGYVRLQADVKALSDKLVTQGASLTSTMTQTQEQSTDIQVMKTIQASQTANIDRLMVEMSSLNKSLYMLVGELQRRRSGG